MEKASELSQINLDAQEVSESHLMFFKTKSAKRDKHDRREISKCNRDWFTRDAMKGTKRNKAKKIQDNFIKWISKTPQVSLLSKVYQVVALHSKTSPPDLSSPSWNCPHQSSAWACLLNVPGIFLLCEILQSGILPLIPTAQLFKSLLHPSSTDYPHPPAALPAKTSFGTYHTLLALSTHVFLSC